MRQTFTRALDWIEKAAVKLCSVFLIVAVVGAFAEVVSRYVFGKSHAYMMELTVLMWVFGSFLLAGVILRRDEHIKFTLLLGKLKGRARQRVDAAIVAIVLVYSVLLAWSGIAHVIVLKAGGVRSMSELWYPLWPTRLILPLSAVLLFLYSIERLAHLLRHSHDQQDGEKADE